VEKGWKTTSNIPLFSIVGLLEALKPLVQIAFVLNELWLTLRLGVSNITCKMVMKKT
jgi:hypothetical protein